jgi:hypothetical protein
VPLVISPNLVASSADYANNQVNFFAVTEGTTGFHGKDFSQSSNSAVYGAAQVATPVIGSQPDDVIFARTYSGIGKVPKEDGLQVGLQWFTRFN